MLSELLEIFTILYYLGLHELDLWMFNIVFTTLFMINLLKKPLFKHQLVSLGVIFVTNIISKISINICFNEYKAVENKLGHELLCILIYIYYF